MFVPTVWLFAVGATFILLGAIAAELWRSARDAEDCLARMSFTARFQRQRAEQAEAQAQELECRLRHVLELHAEELERRN